MKNFLEQRCTRVARYLIGCRLVNESSGAAGIIVETEAYLGENDPACHYDGRSTKRGRVFEKGPGTVYLYKIHGHGCMNFICGSESYPEGVLIRAIEPTDGIADMKERRGKEDKYELCSGPGKLTEAFEIDREGFNGTDIEESDLRIERTDEEHEVRRSRRIGISSAEDWPLRFIAAGSDFLSKPVEEPDQDFDAESFYEKEDLEA